MALSNSCDGQRVAGGNGVAVEVFEHVDVIRAVANRNNMFIWGDDGAEFCDSVFFASIDSRDIDKGLTTRVNEVEVARWDTVMKRVGFYSVAVMLINV